MRTFGTLLTRLQEIAESAHTPEVDAFAEAIRSWRVVLVNPLSLNLRNEYLPGLRDNPQQTDMVLLLHVVAHLRAIGLTAVEPD